MILQDRGKLNANDLACKYLSDCPAAWQAITIRNLLTHTSGLPAYNGPEYRTAPVPVTHAEVLDRLKSKPLEFAPGEKFKYTNSGYYVLGVIIERVSGTSYNEFLQQYICGPLGMRHTGYYGARSIVRNRASGYSLLKDSSLVGGLYQDPSLAFSAGSMWSTTEDLLRFDTALHSGRLLSRNALDEMFTPFKESYGYGLEISQEKNNHTLIAHFGSTSGFTGFFGHYPAEHLAVIILSNKPDFGDLGTMVDALSAIVFGEAYALRVRKSDTQE